MTEREAMEFDVVIVGGGPAGLACAIHLMDLVQKHNETAADKLAPEVVLIEKGKEIGSHAISGAVMDPKGLAQLIPDFKERGAPLEAEVHDDYALWLTEGGGFKFPITPPALQNHGNYVISLNKLVRWMGTIAEEKGVNVLTGFPGADLVMEGNAVRGVTQRDNGVDKHGQPKGNFEPGSNLLAKVTVLAEGSRGSLTKQLVHKLNLHGTNPQIYGTGVKEVWEVPAGQCPPGLVVHTMGYPLKGDTFGGGWVYGMGKTEDGKNLVSVGLVVGLDYRDPTTDPHHEFQRYKLNPKIRAFLAGGKMVSYGAKTLPEGGLFSMPRPYGDGFLIIGDSGGFLDGMRLKGVHLAIRSGMLAAETILAALIAKEFGSKQLGALHSKFAGDWSHAEMRKTRNFHQGFAKGRMFGLFNAGFVTLTGGRGAFFMDQMKCTPGHEHMRTLADYHGGRAPERAKLPEGGKLTFDKLTDLYSSGTKHEEDQPCHLVVTQPDVCVTRCTKEYGNPCQHFCPAAVYEMVPRDDGKLKLQINASNCVHCKTCDIMDPYQIINWVPPEGGGGPLYQQV